MLFQPFTNWNSATLGKMKYLWFCELIGWGMEAVEVEFHLNAVSSTCSGLAYGYPGRLPLKKVLLFISRIYLMLTCRICHNLVQWTFFSAVLFHFIENKHFVVVQMHTIVVVSEAHCFFFLFFFSILLLKFDMFATSSQNSLNKKSQGTLLMFSTLLEIVSLMAVLVCGKTRKCESFMKI